VVFVDNNGDAQTKEKRQNDEKNGSVFEGSSKRQRRRQQQN